MRLCIKGAGAVLKRFFRIQKGYCHLEYQAMFNC
jgi:hypothetical protein